MTAKLYVVDRAGFGQQLSVALTAKYGAGVTIHYATATDCVFTCAALSNKTIRIGYSYIYYDSDDYYDKLVGVIGSSWSTGTTLLDPLTFCGSTNSSTAINYPTILSTATVVLGDTFLIVDFDTCVWPYNNLLVLGKLTNGQSVVLGLTTDTNVSYNANFHAWVTDDTISELVLPTISSPIRNGTEMVLFPLIFAKGGTTVLKNEDQSYATLAGLYNAAENLCPSVSNTYWMSNRQWYYTSRNEALLCTPLFCTLDQTQS